MKVAQDTASTNCTPQEASSLTVYASLLLPQMVLFSALGPRPEDRCLKLILAVLTAVVITNMSCED